MAEAPGWWQRAGRRARRDTQAAARILTSRRTRGDVAEGLRDPQGMPKRHRHGLVLLALLAAPPMNHTTRAPRVMPSEAAMTATGTPLASRAANSAGS